MILKEEIKTFWAKFDPTEDKKAEIFLNLLLENRKESQKKYLQSFYFLIILFAIYFLLSSKQIEEVNFLSIKINNPYILKWIIMTTSSFILYSCISYLNSEYYYRESIEAFFDKYVPDLATLKLKKLYSGPSIINFEFFIGEIKEDKFSRIFFSFLIFTFIALPYFILIYFLIDNCLEWKMIESNLLKTAFLIITTIFLIRSLTLLKFAVSFD